MRPAGPDLKPQLTVAGGSDDIGIGVSNQVISAESNGVPLKIIAQMFQDSANRYILKSQNAIKSLKDLKGKKVGLWLGGDEAEFVAMLKTQGMTLKDVQVVPQGFSVAPFLEDQYVLSEVTAYNELLEIQSTGYQGPKLQILSPADYNSAIVGDMVFTREAFIQQHPDLVKRFLDASMRGWQYCLAQPQAAIDLVLKENPSLNRSQQIEQLRVVSGLIASGGAVTHGLGYMDPQYYATATHVLLDSGQISTSVSPQSVFDATAWQALSSSVTKVPATTITDR